MLSFLESLLPQPNYKAPCGGVQEVGRAELADVVIFDHGAMHGSAAIAENAKEEYNVIVRCRVPR